MTLPYNIQYLQSRKMDSKEWIWFFVEIGNLLFSGVKKPIMNLKINFFILYFWINLINRKNITICSLYGIVEKNITNSTCQQKGNNINFELLKTDMNPVLLVVDITYEVWLSFCVGTYCNQTQYFLLRTSM